ncbi:MAG: dual specificity protein phosphatase family protein [Bdellovibrionales bacterium]|nr:dual specificity protein phosphatase family protein [Bdellovibrionales bacterium]
MFCLSHTISRLIRRTICSLLLSMLVVCPSSYAGSKKASTCSKKLSFSKIKTTQKPLHIMGGELQIGHRPQHRKIKNFARDGFTHIVTIQGPSEAALTIGRMVEENNMTWVWLPLSRASVPSSEKEDQIAEEFLSQLTKIFTDSEHPPRVYIHCAAGIHRTGMYTFALLRRLGYTFKQSKRLLYALSPQTAENMGEERLIWADNVGKKRPKN